MTDNEIIKALKCCGDPYSICAECPIKDDRGCNEQLANYALDLINRQRVEIERLNSTNDKNFSQWHILSEKTKQHYADLYNEAKDILKAEAVKEFAERLKEEAYPFPFGIGVENAVTIRDINDILKEMVGEYDI